ncbi:PREDICTED: calcium/calmodulin-dependent 3',5'-cyclic nucleotide phosphodiesterase 1C-like isoform X2 [Papilio xuthus]|uniref:Phosphodiesterase n=1 Tax=Papilio xuthus TaxID=66420 RepID=A0AAJ6Z098_PAPXU|nr:PREDICTED: calcium/calmodulin-dependent 3',5'-cyclic nucleotide phosphodiesterase 1C-like isoform X2 [Papilio xuthus]
MQHCGFCSMVSDFLCRTLCVGSRRGSSDTYYRELGDQDTLRIDDNKSSTSSSFSNDVEEIIHESQPQARRRSDEDAIANMNEKAAVTGRFLTLKTRRRRPLLPKVQHDELLLDTLQLRQQQCILNQSALWNFNAFALENVSGGRCLPELCYHLFHEYGLISHYRLDAAMLWRLFSLIEEGYRSSNPYHNAVHAADVTQAMHCFLQQKQILPFMEPQELLACLLAAMAHDLDHPGVNQTFLIATSDYIANLYDNKSVLENHHWRCATSCLIESGVMESLSHIWSSLQDQISALILATDITRQQEYLNVFKGHIDNNTLDLRKREHRFLVMQIALKCADISNPCRPWEISRNWSFKVCEEFFKQGEYERKLKIPVSALCDRNTISIPNIQIGFGKFIVTPLIMEWHRFLQNDLSTQMLDNLLSNLNKWEQLMVIEGPEKKRTEAPDTDTAKNDIEVGSELSDSSELLLPGRRSSLNPIKPKSIKEQLRRFSVPLNILQEKKIKRRVKSRASVSSSETRRGASRLDIQFSVRSQQSSPERGQAAVFSTEKYLSTENLLQVDDTDDEGNRQTFSNVETTFLECLLPPRYLHKSTEDIRSSPQTTKTDFLQRLENLKATKFRWFKKSEADKNGRNEASTSGTATQEGGRREARGDAASTMGSRLRDNLSAVTLDGLHLQQLTPRRKSMPADVTSATAGAPKEKKVLDLAVIPPLLKHAASGKEECRRRRGSAPAPVAVSELRGLAQSAQGAQVARSGAPTGTRKKASAVATCQQWLARASNAQEKSLSNIPRRSSLPIEVMTGTAYQ